MQKLMEVITRPVAMMLAVTMVLFGISGAAASADMVTTGAMLRSAEARSDRQKVVNFLDQARVQRELTKLGVPPAEARARVAALSDSQLHELAGRIQKLPAGGDILEVALLVFVILLITDILGFTDVFPFVHHHVHLRGER
ncbi:MAG: PA2779 family protein [Acidiferrobacteraceae bacterium]